MRLLRRQVMTPHSRVGLPALGEKITLLYGECKLIQTARFAVFRVQLNESASQLGEGESMTMVVPAPTDKGDPDTFSVWRADGALVFKNTNGGAKKSEKQLYKALSHLTIVNDVLCEVVEHVGDSDFLLKPAPETRLDSTLRFEVDLEGWEEYWVRVSEPEVVQVADDEVAEEAEAAEAAEAQEDGEEEAEGEEEGCGGIKLPAWAAVLTALVRDKHADRYALKAAALPYSSTAAVSKAMGMKACDVERDGHGYWTIEDNTFKSTKEGKKAFKELLKTHPDLATPLATPPPTPAATTATLTGGDELVAARKAPSAILEAVDCAAPTPSATSTSPAPAATSTAPAPAATSTALVLEPTTTAVGGVSVDDAQSVEPTTTSATPDTFDGVLGAVKAKMTATTNAIALELSHVSERKLRGDARDRLFMQRYTPGDSATTVFDAIDKDLTDCDFAAEAASASARLVAAQERHCAAKRAFEDVVADLWAATEASCEAVTEAKRRREVAE